MSKDHKLLKKYLTIARGQLDGIIKMIDEDRYCLDISDQLMASRALLKKANNQILKNHIDHCVKEAIVDGNADDALSDISTILEYYSRL